MGCQGAGDTGTRRLLRALVVWPGVGWSVSDVARGWANGLEAMGVDVVRFRLDQRIDWLSEAALATQDGALDTEAATRVNREVRLRAAESLHGAVFQSNPDFVVIVSGWDIPPATYELLRERGVRVVLVHTESPYEDIRQVGMSWCADLHLLNDPIGVEHMRTTGVRAEYSRHCYDPTIHYPGGVRDLNAVFVGSGFAGRADLLAQVDWQALGGLTLAGQWDDDGPLGRWCPRDLPAPIPNELSAALYRRSKLGLNLYRVDYVQHPDLCDGWAMGPREVEMAACGLFFLRQSRPESNKVFPMLPVFADAGELTDLAAWWLAHDEAREDATRAMLAAVADRTFTNNARGLLGLVEKVWGQVDRRQPLTV